jgi:hypothetical protein
MVPKTKYRGLRLRGWMIAIGVGSALAACAVSGAEVREMSGGTVEPSPANMELEACLGETPAGFEPLSDEETRSLFKLEWVELVYGDGVVVADHHEWFGARGDYRILGGRVPRDGTYFLRGPLLITSIPDGPEFYRMRRRLLLNAVSGGDTIYVHECGDSGSVHPIRFKPGE